MGLRKAAMPAHRLIGMIIFVMCLCATLMGLAERAAWKSELALPFDYLDFYCLVTCWLKDNEMCLEMWIANLFGLIVLAYSGMVIWLVTHQPWIRKLLPCDNASPLASQRRVAFASGEADKRPGTGGGPAYQALE